MNARSVEFFWDVSSPYCYLIATQLGAFTARTGAQVAWRPFLLGGVFKATDGRPPVPDSAKARYMPVDVKRWAGLYRIPFNFPKVFPLRSVLPQRLACAALGRLDPPSRLPLALMAAYWVEGRDLSQREELARLCRTFVPDASALLDAAEQQPAKDLLRANTDEALRRGAFGAPALFLGDHLFWGNDRLGLLEACLKGLVEP